MNDIRNIQAMTFQQKVLWEAKQESLNKNKRRKTFWVEVKLADGQTRKYQLAKDLQKGMWQHIKSHPKNWREELLGALINVPVSKYDEQGNADITVGLITKIWIEKRHISRGECVTRSQFLKPKYNWLGFAKYGEMLNYLKHDYSEKSVNNINRDLHRLIRQIQHITFSKKAREILNKTSLVLYLWFACLLVSPLIYLLGKTEMEINGDMGRVLSLSILLVFIILVLIMSLKIKFSNVSEEGKQKNTHYQKKFN